MRKVVAILGVLCLGLAALAGGTAPFGRVALSMGMPGLATLAFGDPAWRGVAAYRAGDFEAAAGSFDAAGAYFNLGNARAQQKQYAASLEAYDRARATQVDAATDVNFDLVMAIYAGVEIEAGSIVSWWEDKVGDTLAAEVARGSARAAGGGDSVNNTGALIGLPELETHGRLGVRKVFDDTFVVASPRWLATLEDVPGAFLGARISFEHKRRRKDGTGQPKAETPW